MERQLILGLGQETYKMTLEHFVVREGKKVLRHACLRAHTYTHTHIDGDTSEEHTYMSEHR